jgi:hypothetical protein
MKFDRLAAGGILDGDATQFLSRILGGLALDVQVTCLRPHSKSVGELGAQRVNLVTTTGPR